MATKQIVGQQLMDLYYKQYKTNSDFFDLDDFIRFVGNAWAYLLVQEYKENYALMAKEGVIDVVGFSHDFIQEQVVDVRQEGNTYFGRLKSPIMGFPYDQRTTGIQNVFPIGNQGCGEIIRASIDEQWMDCYLPRTSKRFWHLQTRDKMIFTNIEQCNLKKVSVLYIPAPEDPNLIITEGKVGEVLSAAMLLMKGEENKIIPSVNNQNKDRIIQTEADLKPNS